MISRGGSGGKKIQSYLRLHLPNTFLTGICACWDSGISPQKLRVENVAARYWNSHIFLRSVLLVVINLIFCMQYLLHSW